VFEIKINNAESVTEREGRLMRGRGRMIRMGLIRIKDKEESK
jgi:hypothetical protein